MHGEAEYDLVDQYGIPREPGRAAAAPAPPPKSGGALESFASDLTDQVERGVNAMGGEAGAPRPRAGAGHRA
ncbi:hypothetical protein STCU_12337 [Strigomonas culicis]|uniref:Uncharacterized protein n=1 Tax=Strigomonas culicis TaxID=28005 RepID=S9TDV7_9TRYP|nr:hypothetical protein STCU_12337 [Strigomonas culicis]|eukprot:EPY15114.1 hypothetical protein STCU_12337 [Strigomonas culicis]